MQSTADYVERKTSAFWFISSIRRGRVVGGLNIGQAIQGCNELLDTLNPNRPLHRQADLLLQEIISDEDLPVTQSSRVLALVRV